MGDVVSSHLDEAKRDTITAQTRKVMAEFGRLYERQFAVALFNKVRFDIEGGGGPQPQLLHRKIALENKSIFSGSISQYIEENKKWKTRFLFVPDSYNIRYYDSKSSYDKQLHAKGTINCAGYKVLTSVEHYLDLISHSLPDVKAKVGGSPFLKISSQFPLILWHPYARHYFFCVVTEKEQQKWHAVLQDCVRHSNDGLCEEHKIQTPAFTDAVRLYRQAQGHYGTWEMMCGVPAQILANLVMEVLLLELRELICPRLKGKPHERQRSWMLISDTVYSMVQAQCQARYEAVVHTCEAKRSTLEASIRTDMDQIITSKEHVTTKVKAVVLPKAEKLLKVSIEPYISSILDALMEPTSRGFSEVRDVFFRELVEMCKNTLNNGTKEMVAQHMEKISMLAFHPVKMQSCYEKVEHLSLEGLQQRFDVSSPSVFTQRAQILMRKQMDNAVYTFEHILHQSLESHAPEDLCKTIQRCQDRVIKKFDYDSSTVRKRFFREALLQIFIPYMLKQLGPFCASELSHFQELIFEDFSCFILVENIFEEVVLHSVMKDIMMAVKEAAAQRRHNLYRDSIVLSNSDPNLHLLGENPPIDWAEKYGAGEEEVGEEEDGEGHQLATQKRKRMKQVVSMIQVEGSTIVPESCMEVPTVDVILEENSVDQASSEQNGSAELKVSENHSDLPSGSTCRDAEAKLEEQHEDVPLRVESAAEGAPVKAQQEKDKDTQPVLMEEEAPSSQEELEVGAPPETTGNPPDMCSSSTVKESPPEEQCQADSPLKVQSTAGGVSVTEEDQGGVSLSVGEKEEPLHNQEELGGPPLPEEFPSEAPEMSLENPPDLVLLTHNDSGFQSPTSEVVDEGQKTSCTPPPQHSQEVETSDTASRNQ